ncbi:MAG: 30S ribosomal protein S13 [Candidatus Woesearchaeota archaeon]|nr:30S ribosomal protein S13 [Candidatus Woesearchaeota archaeon]
MAEFKYLIRIANTDLDGKKAVVIALKDIRGVGIPLANAVCQLAKIPGFGKIGNLSDVDIKRLDELVRNIEKQPLPSWMFNRRRDPETNVNRHVITNDLIFNKENDIKMMKRIKCYKGVRHSFSQPVRGQRTRSNFRANKGKVMGVKTSGKAKPASKKSGPAGG